MPDMHGAAPLGQSQPPVQPGQPPEIEYPKGLPPEQHAGFRRFRELQLQNQQAERDLAARYGAELEQSSILGMRFQALLDVIWPKGTAKGETFRLQHDLAYQRTLAQQWEMLRVQVVQARLARGMTLAPEEQALLTKLSQSGAPGLFGNGG